MIPCPVNEEYLPYQIEGIEFARIRNSVLFGDEMGLGKTVEAIGWLNCHPEIESLLIVCPATLKVNWARELAKWLISPCVEVTIINYDMLHTLDTERVYDAVILDEAHYIKNPKALRSKHCLKIQAKNKLCLTGTPILSRPIELWHLLHFLAPELWPRGSYMKFAIRYCGAYQRRVRTHNGWRWVWDMRGATRLDELKMHLSYLMIRRMKSDVLKDLPPKRRQIIELPTVGLNSELRYELKAAATRMEDLINEYAVDVANLDGAITTAWNQMAELRHQAGLAKVAMAVDIIHDAVEASGKVVVFAHHRDVIASLRDALVDYMPAVIHGDTPQAARQGEVDRFQNDDRVKVFIGQIQAAGVGITLTAASHVIFVELDWTPGIVNQAEDRCHRIGQKNAVLVQHLALENSLDAVMAKTLVRKQSIIEKALDAKN
jgi:SWI/SNF-related matrix-associated actin-dependent regulator of chromatin subfamily A-like protein 1